MISPGVPTEAKKFIELYGFSRVPYIGRENSLLFFSNLYKKGALSVIVCDLNINHFITEILISCGSFTIIKNVVLEILKTNPYSLEEIKRNVFKVKWKLGWE